MSTRFQVLGIVGSLRKASYNRCLLNAAIEVAPPELAIEVASLDEIPFYNGDVEAGGLPPAVVAFRERIRAADAVLIATPEYNYSIPGVLKNAIDWASRAPDQPFSGKPLCIMGASMGGGGTIRAQSHLRLVTALLNMHPLNRPEIYVSLAHDKFNAEGKLTDESTRKNLTAQMQAFAAWISVFKK